MNPSKPLPRGALLLILEFQPQAQSDKPYPETTTRRIQYYASPSDLAGIESSKVGSALQRIVYEMLEKVVDGY